MVDNMLDINAPNFPRYYEVCDTKYQRGGHITKNYYETYCYYNNKEDQHISVFTHDESWITNYNKTGSVSCRNTDMGVESFYLELDRPTLKEAWYDANKILMKFDYPEAINLWYSGNNSIHIEINAQLFGSPMGSQHNLAGIGKLIYNLAHKIAGDSRHNNGLSDPYTIERAELFNEYKKTFNEEPDTSNIQKVRQSLETIDPNLFRVNSLIRQPFSIHEKGGKMKTKLKLDSFKNFSYIKNKEKKREDKERFTNTLKPKLINWIYDCYEPKITKRSYSVSTDSDFIVKTFSKVFDYFDPDDANAEGWVNKLFSPFYEDTNPSVSVNIDTGYYQDFGEPTHSFNFYEFYGKINSISPEQAKEKLT
jgi:hypothetical protein